MFFQERRADMNNKVPQVEFISGSTPQESTQMVNARMRELGCNSPTFERDGIGFWITYTIDIDNKPEKPKRRSAGQGVCCPDCPCFELASDRAKWGKCQRHGNVSVSCRKKVCDTYWILIEGGDEINA